MPSFQASVTSASNCRSSGCHEESDEDAVDVNGLAVLAAPPSDLG